MIISSGFPRPLWKFQQGRTRSGCFLDIEKTFDNVWHNGLRYKIFMLDLLTKMTRWLSDFLVGRLIQVNVNGFLSDKISPIARLHTGFCSESITFPDIREWLAKTSPQTKLETTNKTRNPSLLMTLLYGLLVKMYNLRQNFCIMTYENWQSGVPNGE